MHSRRYRFAPGALLLAQHGVSQVEIADKIGVTPAAVSRYVGGKVRPHKQFYSVVSALAGADVADELRDIIEATPKVVAE